MTGLSQKNLVYLFLVVMVSSGVIGCGGGGENEDMDVGQEGFDSFVDEGDTVQDVTAGDDVNDSRGSELTEPDAIDVQNEEVEDSMQEDFPSIEPGPPGETCSCDSDCMEVGGQEGICVYGICMVRARGDCSSAGSTEECPPHLRCWGLRDHPGSICWPDCNWFDCSGECDSDGSCVPSSGMNCNSSCGSYCSGCSVDEDCPDGYVCSGGVCERAPCSPGSCPEGEICVDGECVLDIGEGPGPFPGDITCSEPLPPLMCEGGEEYCSELIQFDPTYGYGYIDYPENGETWDNQYRSWLRRDVVMLIKYATAKVACWAEDWTTGNGAPLGLIDMSEQDGSIPGTSIGRPAHPPGTHTNGFDIDVAYYQTTSADNRARPICEHYSGGVDAYHCTAPPHLLDVWRTALFLGAVFEHPSLRVVGCDGRAGSPLMSAIQQLCTSGWITSYACRNRRLAYEETDTGLGWFYFHHHHMHVSFSDPYRSGQMFSSVPCLIPGCRTEELMKFLKSTVFKGIK